MVNKQLSIIIPTFNAASTIVGCLKSIQDVLGESLDKIEVIVKDGESSDATIYLTEEFANCLPLIVLTGKDKGIYDAMNFALDHSKGKWKYFLGSDDKLLPDFEKALDILVKLNARTKVLYGNVLAGTQMVRFCGEVTAKKLIQRNICHQAMFFREDVFDIIGKFNTNYIINADYDMNLRLFAAFPDCITFRDLDVAYFNDTGLSMSGHLDTRFILDKKYIVKSLFSNLEEWDQINRDLEDSEAALLVNIIDNEGVFQLATLRYFRYSPKLGYFTVMRYILGTLFKQLKRGINLTP